MVAESLPPACPDPDPLPDLILRLVAREYDLSLAILRGPLRTREVRSARLAVFLALTQLGYDSRVAAALLRQDAAHRRKYDRYCAMIHPDAFERAVARRVLHQARTAGYGALAAPEQEQEAPPCAASDAEEAGRRAAALAALAAAPALAGTDRAAILAYVQAALFGQPAPARQIAAGYHILASDAPIRGVVAAHLARQDCRAQADLLLRQVRRPARR
jgi:hypothetical protein